MNPGYWSDQWKPEPAGDGSYYFLSRRSGKALIVQNARNDDGAPIVLYAKPGGAHHRWKLEK